MPRLDLFISLVGALSSSCLALIFPPLIDLATGWSDSKEEEQEEEEERSKYRWFWYAKNFAICIFGIVGFVTGTYASLKDIVNYFIHPQEDV